MLVVKCLKENALGLMELYKKQRGRYLHNYTCISNHMNVVVFKKPIKQEILSNVFSLTNRFIDGSVDLPFVWTYNIILSKGNFLVVCININASHGIYV